MTLTDALRFGATPLNLPWSSFIDSGTFLLVSWLIPGLANWLVK